MTGLRYDLTEIVFFILPEDAQETARAGLHGQYVYIQIQSARLHTGSLQGWVDAVFCIDCVSLEAVLRNELNLISPNQMLFKKRRS